MSCPVLARGTFDPITEAVRQTTEHDVRDLVTRADFYRVLLAPTGNLIGAAIAVLRLFG